MATGKKVKDTERAFLLTRIRMSTQVTGLKAKRTARALSSLRGLDRSTLASGSRVKWLVASGSTKTDLTSKEISTTTSRKAQASGIS